MISSLGTDVQKQRLTEAVILPASWPPGLPGSYSTKGINLHLLWLDWSIDVTNTESIKAVCILPC